MTEYEIIENELLSIQERWESDRDALLNQTMDLDDCDYALIGKVIQFYCSADMDARRVIDALRHAAHGPHAANGMRLRDSQVFPKLREAVEELWPSNWRDGLLKAVDIIEMHRMHRHTFSHWTARKLRNEDKLILFTKNAREAERRDGVAPGPEEAKYAIVPLLPLRKELQKLVGHGHYLAKAATEFEDELESYKIKFAQQHS